MGKPNGILRPTGKETSEHFKVKKLLLERHWIKPRERYVMPSEDIALKGGKTPYSIVKHENVDIKVSTLCSFSLITASFDLSIAFKI